MTHLLYVRILHMKGALFLEYIKNPFNYTGAKYKLFSQIFPLFPDNIERFVDLFGGSAEVSMNVDAKVRVYNDKCVHIVNILQQMDDTFIDEVKAVIKQWNLSKTCKEEFYALRQYWNDNRKVLTNREHAVIMYTILAHAFNNQLAFNSEGAYNMASGTNRASFNATMEKNLRKYIERKNEIDIQFNYSDFYKINLDDVRKTDFYYADPPYLITVGAYERNYATRWSEDYEYKLLNLLDALHNCGCKFALSNVLEHKGKRNDILCAWAEKYNVHHLSMTYKACNYQTHVRDVKESDEVLITNY